MKFLIFNLLFVTVITARSFNVDYDSLLYTLTKNDGSEVTVDYHELKQILEDKFEEIKAASGYDDMLKEYASNLSELRDKIDEGLLDEDIGSNMRWTLYSDFAEDLFSLIGWRLRSNDVK